MQVTLGHALDGPVYRDLPPSGAEAGHAIAGPLRLLDILKTTYGIAASSENKVLRVLQYEKILSENIMPGDFFARSFNLDSYGVAQRLLDARDRLLLAARSTFSLQAVKASGSRMAVLGRIEKAVEGGGLAPGEADSIRLVLQEMRKGAIPDIIKRIELTEPKEFWPPLWRELFEELGKQKTTITEYAFTATKARGDLQTARGILDLANHTPTDAKGDGTLALIEANNRLEQADVCALLIRELRKAGKTVAVVARTDSSILDEALGRIDEPRAGSKDSSSGLDAAQVLPLLLLLQWEPLDIELLLRYLNLAVSPLPHELRHKLRDCLLEKPGVGNNAWNRALKSFTHSDTGTVVAGHKHLLDSWLDTGTVPRAATLGLDRVHALCERIIQWAGARRGSEDRPDRGMHVAVDQAKLLCHAASLRHPAGLTHAQLVRLLADIFPSADVSCSWRREIGGAFAVRSPAAILSPVDVVVWWDAGELNLEPLAERFWGDDEAQALGKAGVDTGEVERALRLEALLWQRCVSMAGEALFLVFARLHGDLRDEPHPVWHEISSCFTDGTRGKLYVSANDLVRGEQATALGTRCGGALIDTGARNLPPARGTWTVASSVVVLREKDSASSLELMAACPLAYGLRYFAGIESGDVSALSSGPLLSGTVAHAVLGGYLDTFRDTPSWPSGTGVKKDLSALCDRVLAVQAGQLLVPGFEAERQSLCASIVRAGLVLVGILRRSGLCVESVESDFAKDTGIGTLQGRCDLVVYKAGNKADKGIIDMKWSRRTMRYGFLRDGRAIQLGVYSKIAGDNWPHTSFFLVKSAEMLTVHGDFFKTATTLPGPGEQEVWERIESQLGERKKTMARGCLALGVPRPSSGEADPLPLAYAECRYCDYSLFSRADVRDENEEQGGGR